MYISLFDINLSHISNVTNITLDMAKHTYDMNTFKGSGECTIDVKNAVLYTLNEDNGTLKHAGFVKNTEQKDNTVTVFGDDFKTLMSTEVLLDFINDTYPTTVSGLFTYILNKVITSTDIYISKIACIIDIYEDLTDTTSLFGNLNGQRKSVNAYEFLLPYFKYCSYAPLTTFDWEVSKIRISIEKQVHYTSVKIKDFEHEMANNKPEFNKAIATMDIKPCNNLFSTEFAIRAFDKFGAVVTNGYAIGTLDYVAVREKTTYTLQTFIFAGTYTQSEFKIFEYNSSHSFIGAISADATSLKKTFTTRAGCAYIKWHHIFTTTISTDLSNFKSMLNYGPEALEYEDYIPQPNTSLITTKYYYLTSDNQITESDNIGDITNRIFPVKTKYFVEEFLANAQYNAILSLCEARNVDNIYLDANSPINPIDLNNLDLNHTVTVYDENFLKEIPVSEITLKISNNGIDRKVKLGFKRDKFTSIVKDVKKKNDLPTKFRR